MRRPVKQKGIILPIVLWVAITIIAVVATYSSIVRLNIITANTIKDNARIKYIVESVVYREIYKLHLSLVKGMENNMVSKNVSQQDGYVILSEVFPESLKLNINTANRDEFKEILSHMGVGDESARQILSEVFNGSGYRYENGRNINYKNSREIDEMAEKYGVKNLSRYMTVYKAATKPVYSIYVSVIGSNDKKSLKSVVYSQVNKNTRIPYKVIRWES